jgi:hypothetical protein
MKTPTLAEIEVEISLVRHDLRSGLALMQGAFESVWETSLKNPEHLELQTAGNQRIEASISSLFKLSDQIQEITREKT